MPVEIHASSLLHSFPSLLLLPPPSPNRPPFLNDLCCTKTLSKLYYEDKFSFKRIIPVVWGILDEMASTDCHNESTEMQLFKISIIFLMLSGKIIGSKYLFRFSSLLLYLRKNIKIKPNPVRHPEFSLICPLRAFRSRINKASLNSYSYLFLQNSPRCPMETMQNMAQASTAWWVAVPLKIWGSDLRFGFPWGCCWSCERWEKGN